MSKSPKTTTAPTGNIAPFGLRMLPELREKVEQAARESGRSMNAEIVARLENSFQVHGSGTASMKMTAEHVEQPSADEIAAKVAERLGKMLPLFAKTAEDLDEVTPDYARPVRRRTPTKKI